MILLELAVLVLLCWNLTLGNLLLVCGIAFLMPVCFSVMIFDGFGVVVVTCVVWGWYKTIFGEFWGILGFVYLRNLVFFVFCLILCNLRILLDFS